MPERSAYDEAILLPQVRLRIQDKELTEGQVERFQIRMAQGFIERPWGVEGGFAVVYKYRTRNGKLRALRCFRQPISADMQFRYEAISAYFASHAPSITAEFIYHNDSIVVKEQIYGQLQSNLYPVIEMEWVEGETLLEYVDEQCRQRNKTELARLAEQWIEVLQITRKAKISHGDLAAVNVMVRPDGRLVLIDYDGVYIPTFSTMDAIVLGQVDYQHPDMVKRPFNEYTDDFSALVIYTALLALQMQPELWETRVLRGPNGRLVSTNLLFSRDDFLAPDRSSLFQMLVQHRDARLASAAQALKRACEQPVDAVQFPWQLANYEQEQALKQLLAALNADDDEQIVKAWLPVLDSYGPAQPHRPRMEHALQNVQAVIRLREALLTRNVQEVVSSYHPRLEQCAMVTKPERDLVELASSFLQAVQSDDEQAIVNVWDEMQNLIYKDFFQLTPQEQQAVMQAQQRHAALLRFRIALLRRDIALLAAAYTSELEHCKGMTNDERQLSLDACRFIDAFRANDDEALLAASQQLQSAPYLGRVVFTVEEQQRLTLARLRLTALKQWREAIAQKKAQDIVNAYGVVLNECKGVTAQERILLKQVRNFLQAYHRGDDEALATLSTALQDRIIFTSQEQQRISLARQYSTALQQLRTALTSQQVTLIATGYDPLLDACKAVSQSERECVELARAFCQVWQADDDQALMASWEAIQNGPHKAAFVFTSQEEQRITLARQRIAALVKFRLAIMKKQTKLIVQAYNPILDDCKNVTAEERAQFELANALVQADNANDHQQMTKAWRAIQASAYATYFIFTGQERQRIMQAMVRSMKQGEAPHA